MKMLLALTFLISAPTLMWAACLDDGMIRCGRIWANGDRPEKAYRQRAVREDPPGSGRCTYKYVPLPSSFSCSSVGSKNPYVKTR